MAKAGDNPFRSGNTAALDLEDLDKADGNDPWAANQKSKNPWASKEWSGGKDRWPEDFGGSSGTAALDLSDFNPDEQPQQRDDSWRDGEAFGGEMEVDDFWANSPRRTNDSFGFDDFGDSPRGNTMALELDELQAGPPGTGKPMLKRRAERNEDFRNPHTHNDQRGRRSYEGGQGDPNSGGARTTRGKGRSYEPARPQNQTIDPLAEFPLPPEEEGDLMPHERTMAVPMDQIQVRTGGAVGAERTESIDMAALRRPASVPSPPVGELAPHERTQAFDLQALEDEETVPEELLATHDMLPPADAGSGLRKARGGGPPVPANPNIRTTVIDQKELDNLRHQEASSGGQLLIFVPGVDPVPFELRPGVTNIGRERTNHLVISDPFCSRKHLRIKKQGEEFTVRDNGSDNGTLLDGQPMTPQQDIPIIHGADITIGSTVMRLIIGQPQGPDFTPPVLPNLEPVSDTAIPMMPAPVPSGTGRLPPIESSAPPARSKTWAVVLVIVGLLLLLLAVGGAVVAFYFWNNGA